MQPHVAPEPMPWFRPRRSTLTGLRLILEAGPVVAPALAVVSVIEGLLPTAFTVATGRLVARAQATADWRDLLPALVAVAVIFMAAEVIEHTRFAVGEGFRHRVEGRRRERAMAAAMHPPGVTHLETPEVLDMVRMAARSEWPDASAFTVSVFGTLRTRVTAVSAAVLVAGFRWWAAAGLLALWVWTGRVMRQGQAEAYADSLGGLRRAWYLRELVFQPQAAKELRIFSFGGWLIDGFSQAWHGVMREVWRRRRTTRVRQTGVFVAVLAAHAAIFVALVAAARSGELGPARLVVIAPAVLALSRFGQTDEFTLGLALGAVPLPSLEEAERTLITGPRFAVPGDRPATGLPRHAVRFDGVRFTYPGRDTPVFDGLDLRIEAGRSLAIVGANGAGKTTLVKLLARLYDPGEGEITVDGVDLRRLDARQWQRRVAAIFQDFVRFELPASDNVGFGGIERTGDRDRVVSAAERVGALELIESLPNGWDTVLSRRYEGGTELSGGEWQRIALARAAFAVEAGAGILVLDEPTANLDARAEVELFDRFLDVTRGATTILISHRFSTVRRADRIVVLDQGRVVEDGIHDELLAAGGRYARAFLLQARRYHDEVPTDV